MKTNFVLRAQSVMSLKPNVFANVPVFDLVDAVKERYSFREVPSTQSLLNPPSNQPATFIHGRLPSKRTVTVENLQVLNYAPHSTVVSAISRKSTDEADVFLNDMADFVGKEFHIDTKPISPTTYQSQLEVILNSSVKERFDFLQQLGQSITNLLKTYGFSAAPLYEPTGFSMHFDATKPTEPVTLATVFTVERRAQMPFDENKYYSQAPLRTSDHEAVLEHVEKLLSGFGHAKTAT
jgi:hypothetical protein